MRFLSLPVIALIAATTTWSCQNDEPTTEPVDEPTTETTDAVEAEADAVAVETTGDVIGRMNDSGFDVAFPGTPQHSVETLPLEIGDVDLHTYIYESGISKAYMVAYSDYPSTLIDGSDPSTMLVGAKDGAMGNLGIDNMEVEQDIEIDGHPGLYCKGNGNGWHVMYEFYLVGNRLYQVAILQDGSYPESTDADDFFGSFRLI